MTDDTVTGQQYKTGDRHPVHNLMAFVEYDENGVGWWTSIATDPEAPFRLASEKTLDRLRDTRAGNHNESNAQDTRFPKRPPL